MIINILDRGLPETISGFGLTLRQKYCIPACWELFPNGIELEEGKGNISSSVLYSAS